ncbi:alanine aminotransferase 2-like [Harmonia axyridis]|uniref:alanine aminotransferase 2-like n=1 Tax=Harmonia axyridis TaxID=115357 RepID=UPI001E27738E|nr:alanine aminotransferase 2-like [Harmonia axyridis]
MIPSKGHCVLRGTNEKLQCKKCLTPETVNPNYRGLEYSLSGPVLQKAIEIEKEILEGHKKKFKNVILLNIGDAQSLGQPPLTFPRQVLSLVAYPDLLRDKTFPEDVKLRARDILENCPGGSAGSYSYLCGMDIIRKKIATYIEKRDNVASNWENIIIGQGVADMAKLFMSLLKSNKYGLAAGILNPVPECPFYSSIIAELGLKRIDYFIDEDNQWNININELQRAIDEAKSRCNPRAIIVINPGNPTCHILTKSNMEEIVKFAFKENLIIIADEVYQNDVLKDDCDFISFKRILNDMGKPYSDIELVSLMSVSKGVFAESGIKSGYAEFVNLDPEIPPMFVNLASASYNPSALAQSTLYSLVNPPKPNEPSYELFKHEKNVIIGGLKMSASIAEESIHSLEGMSCNPLEGGTFFYPRLMLPQVAIERADRMKLSPDEFYAMELLQETGICVAPGSAFKQKPGTYHIRMTLPSDPEMAHEIMERFKEFHFQFMKSFS